ncbi:MAG: YwaF family protein [Firmicutes bacterium]|nr:YwaF family protein [Bacillota bacterium]
MNYFFGYTPTLVREVNWTFSLNHLFLFLVVCAAFAALYFGLHAKTERGKRITKLVLASVLAVFEIGRYIFFVLQYRAAVGSLAGFNWVGTIPFSQCGIMSITMSIILFISALKRTPSGTVMQFFYNLLFGVGLIGGVLTFTTNDNLNGWFSILHWRNIQTIVVHLLLVFVPIYLIKIGEFRPRMKNLWMIAVGYLSIGIISMTGSQIAGDNFAYALGIYVIFETVGIDWITIPFPWHLLPLLGAMMLLAAALYLPFEIYHRKKHGKDQKPIIQNTRFHIARFVTFIGGYISTLVLLLVIPQAFNATPIVSWLGLVCLVPLPILIGVVLLSWHFKGRALTRSMI